MHDLAHLASLVLTAIVAIPVATLPYLHPIVQVAREYARASDAHAAAMRRRGC